MVEWKLVLYSVVEQVINPRVDGEQIIARVIARLLFSRCLQMLNSNLLILGGLLSNAY